MSLGEDKRMSLWERYDDEIMGKRRLLGKGSGERIMRTRRSEELQIYS